MKNIFFEMSVSVLLQPSFKDATKTFNFVPKFCCARNNFLAADGPSLIKKVGAVFLKFGMQNDFGLVMVHRHFELQNGEILVESENADGSLSVAMPWKIEGGVASPSEKETFDKHSLKGSGVLVPQTWCLAENGHAEPYEYQLSSTEMTDPPKQFVKELCCELKKHGLEKLVGVRRLGNKEAHSYEVTPKDGRSSYTAFGSMPAIGIDFQVDPEQMMKVLWYFDDEGKIHSGGDCNRCGSCGSCS